MERQPPQPRPAPRATSFNLSPVRLAPPLVLMTLMWFLSSQPDLSTGLGLVDLIGRKIVHAASFGALCLLWWRALPGIGAAALAVPFLLAAGYGAVDEYHQTFVAGRVGSPIDVAIDAAGAAIAIVLIRRRSNRHGQAAKRREAEASAQPAAWG